jgi:hypothetical protein
VQLLDRIYGIGVTLSEATSTTPSVEKKPLGWKKPGTDGQESFLMGHVPSVGLFTTIVGNPVVIAISELSLECFCPADAATAETFAKSTKLGHLSPR